MAKSKVELKRTDSKKRRRELLNLYCGNCGRFLLKYLIVIGTIEKSCKRCKSVTTIDIWPDEEE